MIIKKTASRRTGKSKVRSLKSLWHGATNENATNTKSRHSRISFHTHLHLQIIGKNSHCQDRIPPSRTHPPPPITIMIRIIIVLDHHQPSPPPGPPIPEPSTSIPNAPLPSLKSANLQSSSLITSMIRIIIVLDDHQSRLGRLSINPSPPPGGGKSLPYRQIPPLSRNPITC